jgi:hypothetical protein
VITLTAAALPFFRTKTCSPSMSGTIDLAGIKMLSWLGKRFSLIVANEFGNNFPCGLGHRP